MKQLLKDAIGFITSLNQMDLLLYFAVLILIILVVSLIYIIKTSDEEELENPEADKTIYNAEDIDLKEVITNIESSEPPIVEYTDYEREQEEKAIISYDELIERSKMGTVSYATEEVANKEVAIKKINLDKLGEQKVKEETPKTNSLFHYEKEEAFLKALQSLNELLN